MARDPRVIDGYRSRVVDRELTERLRAAGAVLIEGPKACGKTQTALQVAASHVYLDTDMTARQALAVDPRLVLDGPAPRLLDEWQVAPALWNHVRRVVDERTERGQFILTGSAVPADDHTRHTGAGRFSRLRMRPMTLFESGHSSGSISLAALMAGESGRSADPGLSLADLGNRLTAGGWPALQSVDVTGAARGVRDYLEQVVRLDIERVDGVRRDPQKVLAVLRSLARNVATEVRIAQVALDAGGADGELTRATVAGYLEALTRLMIVEDQPAWSTHLRSKATLRQSPKRHFVDPSLAVAALRAGPARLLADLNTMGYLFESLVVRDLRVYSQPLDGEVLHYRDSSGVEVDAIVQRSGGVWGAFEVKLGPDAVDVAAASLRRFAETVDTSRVGTPAVLAVITGSGYGYRRPDGIHVVPIGALGP